MGGVGVFLFTLFSFRLTLCMVGDLVIDFGLLKACNKLETMTLNRPVSPGDTPGSCDHTWCLLCPIADYTVAFVGPRSSFPTSDSAANVLDKTL